MCVCVCVCNSVSIQVWCFAVHVPMCLYWQQKNLARFSKLNINYNNFVVNHYTKLSCTILMYRQLLLLLLLQLQCVGGTAGCRDYLPKAVQCYNKGSDGNDVQVGIN